MQGIIKYAQFSCIFCSIFLYYFSLEVAHQVSNDGLMSFMGISPFLSLIYHIQFSLLTDFFPPFLCKTVSSVARCSPATREARVRFPGRVIPKTLKMEPTAVVRDAPHKQWSKGKQASEPQLEKGRGRPDLNQLVRNWAVKPHLNLNLNLQRYYRHRYQTPIPTLLDALALHGGSYTGQKCGFDMCAVLYGDLHTKIRKRYRKSHC